MYLLKNNQLIKLDTTEDNWRGIKAIKTIDIPSTIVITKQLNTMSTPLPKEYTLRYELDGYIFKNINDEQLGSYHQTIGDAVYMALKMRYKVYNAINEILLPELPKVPDIG